MPKANGEPKDSASRKLNRRTMIGSALAVGGLSALGAALPQSDSAGAPRAAAISEREWARALARHIANQLPEAVRQLPELQLTEAQVQELRRVFQNTLVTNMGCEVPPSRD